MKSTNKTLNFALYLFISYVALFFIMKLLGLEKVAEIRLFNVLIAAFFSNRLAKINRNSNSVRASYLGNFTSLILANLIAIFGSALGLLIYGTAFDKEFMELVGSGFLLGKDLSINQIIIAVVLEGSATAAIVSFTLMQYWKNAEIKSHNSNKQLED